MATVGNWPLVLTWPVDIFTSPRDFSTLSPNREPVHRLVLACLYFPL